MSLARRHYQIQHRESDWPRGAKQSPWSVGRALQFGIARYSLAIENPKYTAASRADPRALVVDLSAREVSLPGLQQQARAPNALREGMSMTNVSQIAEFLSVYVPAEELRRAADQRSYLMQFVRPKSQAAALLEAAMRDRNDYARLVELLTEHLDRPASDS